MMASITGMVKTITPIPPSLAGAGSLSSSSSAYLRRWSGGGGGGGGGMVGPAGLVVECSSRPQKKATAHHRKTRPKKTQPWDVRRKGPTAYPPLPVLPPDWTLVVDGGAPEGEEQQHQPLEESAAAAAAPVL